MAIATLQGCRRPLGGRCVGQRSAQHALRHRLIRRTGARPQARSRCPHRSQRRRLPIATPAGNRRESLSGPAAGRHRYAATPSRETNASQEPAHRADSAAALSTVPRNEIPPARQEPPAFDNVVASADGTGQPGNKQLEGPQSPQLIIQKVAPPEIQVGKPATFRITVRNTGQATAGNVEIHDQSRGTRLLGSAPQAAPMRMASSFGPSAIRPG